jgi:peroxiredoxin
MRRFLILLFLTLFVIGTLAACAKKEEGGKSLHSLLEPYSESVGISVPQKPSKAPDFTLQDLEGRRVTLSDYRGKLVFLNFWATWCPPCRAEMPSMEMLHQKLSDDGLEIVAVDIGETNQMVSDFVKSMELTFTILLDTRQKVSSIYGIRNIPTTFIVDKEGWIAGRAVGARDWSSEDSLKMFQALLQNGEGE